MKVLFLYSSSFGWTPASKTLDDVEADERGPQSFEDVQLAFIQCEPKDEENASYVETKLVKNIKWLARKNNTNHVVLHSFAHLSEDKAEPRFTQELLNRVDERLTATGFQITQTPFGYFLDLDMKAPGLSLARVFKSF